MRILSLSLALLVLAAPAMAQEDVDRDAIFREIEKTDQIIEKARELAAEATVVSSHGHLRTAIRLQRTAREHFAGRRYAQARAFTLDARREALRAMDASRAEKNTLENIARMLEQADERAIEVGQWVRDSGDGQAQRVFDQGLEQLRRARRANRDRHYAQATRLVTLALSLIERAGRLARGEVSAVAAAETSIERTTALLARVRATLRELGESPNQSPGLAEADRLLRLAVEQMREGHARRALRLSLAARQKGLQMLADLPQAPAEQDLRKHSMTSRRCLPIWGRRSRPRAGVRPSAC